MLHSLVVKNLDVQFGGLKALNDISFSVESGSIFGIIGPNGAGKTTLFNCISGFIRPASVSQLQALGRDITGMNVAARSKIGIKRTFQNISLVKGKTARWNILCGLHSELHYGALRTIVGWPSALKAERVAHSRISQIAADLHVSSAELDTDAELLSIGVQKKIELARALISNPEVLLLDEPASGLNSRETEELLHSLLAIGKSKELTMIVIDHDMDLVMPLCHEICVLNFGQKIAQGSAKAVSNDPAVIESYLGAQQDA